MQRGAAQRLDLLRKHRAVHPGATTLSTEITRQAAALSKQRRSLQGLGEAWAEAVPAALGAEVQLGALRRGVLTVRAPDAAAAYALDRWLRAGGLEALRRRAPVALTRIKVLGSGPA